MSIIPIKLTIIQVDTLFIIGAAFLFMLLQVDQLKRVYKLKPSHEGLINSVMALGCKD